jgi:hypothetical protein
MIDDQSLSPHALEWCDAFLAVGTDGPVGPIEMRGYRLDRLVEAVDRRQHVVYLKASRSEITALPTKLPLAGSLIPDGGASQLEWSRAVDSARAGFGLR